MHFTGPALVLAGPGSGKTTVLIRRVRYLIEEKKVSPEKILVVTFAKSAASQMRERFLNMTGGMYGQVTFSTIHSVCYSILNSDRSFGNYSLLPENEKINFISDTIKEFFVNHPDRSRVPGLLKDVLSEMSLLKNNRIEDYKTTYVDPVLFKYCFKRLKDFKEINRYFDFDDMAEMTDKLLSSKKDGKIGAKNYEYVMVDEFQDTGADQFRFLKKLCKDDNFFAVGDEDQSIYGFRGACPEIMLDFKKHFNNCVIYRLPENFRSHEVIVSTSDTLIKNNKKRYDKKPIPSGSFRDKGGIVITAAQNEKEETDILVSGIKKAIKEPGVTAVLVRTRGILDKIAGELIQNNIDFAVKDKVTNIFDVTVVKTVMSFFKVAAGKGDTDDYIRIFKTTELRGFESFIGSREFTWEELLIYYKGDERVKDFEYKVKSINNYSPFIALDLIRNVLGLEKKISVFEKERLNELELILRDIRSIDGVLEAEKCGKGKMDTSSVNGNLILSTIHSAKGLEFDRVFVPCMNEGIIPSSKAITEGEIEEERRIFYVALTRARSSVIISFHEESRNKRSVPSRFLKEMNFKILSKNSI